MDRKRYEDLMQQRDAAVKALGLARDALVDIEASLDAEVNSRPDLPDLVVNESELLGWSVWTAGGVVKMRGGFSTEAEARAYIAGWEHCRSIVMGEPQ